MAPIQPWAPNWMSDHQELLFISYSLEGKPSCHTLSNAYDISRKTRRILYDITHELLATIDLYKKRLVSNQVELEKLDHFGLENRKKNCRVTQGGLI